MCHKLLVMLRKYLNSERPSTILLLERIWGQVKQNSVMVQSLHRQFVEGQIPSTSSVEHFNLPIDSFEDFDRVESLLAEKSQARVFVSATCRLICKLLIIIRILSIFISFI